MKYTIPFLSVLSSISSQIYRQPICNFSDLSSSKQDIHNLNITFSTENQAWINSGTRAEGTSIEPKDSSKSTAKITIGRRNPPDHVFYIQQIQVSVYRRHCLLKHFNQPGIIGEIVFLADMADGSSSKDVIVPIGRGLVSDKIFEVLVNSDPEDEVKLDFEKLNQAQCHFAIHPNRYRSVSNSD